MSLTEWGWNSHWSNQAANASGLLPARVTGGSHNIFELETEAGPQRGELSGKLEYAAQSPADLPVIGDWVLTTPTDPAMIITVLERRSLFTRTLDTGQQQPMAANIDLALIVTGLDGDWNPNRLHRYLVLARDSGAKPLIVCNKRDLCAGAHDRLRSAADLAPAILLSAHQDDVAAALQPFLHPGETAALLGSSGAGKSTILNALRGAAIQCTQPVREHDSRGRHTTTARSLFRLPQGWLLCDMPGIRTVGVGNADTRHIDDTFADITSMALHCRFRDCTHQTESGCAVAGTVSEDRLASYRKLQREAERLQDPKGTALAQKARWKKIHAAMKKRPDKRD